MKRPAPGEPADPVVDEDIDFQHRSWRVQRIGQLGLVAFVVAGLAGVFGGGGLARDRVSDAGRMLRVEHPRFIRTQAPFEMTIHARDSDAGDGRLNVWLDEALLDAFTVEHILPQPRSQTLGPGRLVCEFAEEEASTAAIRLRLEATKAGRVHGRIGIVGGPAVELKHFVYP